MVTLRHINGKRPGSVTTYLLLQPQPTDRPLQKPSSPGRVKRRGDRWPSGPENIGKSEVDGLELDSEDSNLSVVCCASGCRLRCQRGRREMFPVIVDDELGTLSTSSTSIDPIQPLSCSVPFFPIFITRTISYFSRLLAVSLPHNFTNRVSTR
ncbi:hypothetical protein EDD16DRAFT_1646075 [Pisolithus croceorrhizus]|nr:hypothetical protein EDD16DRAFT_1646075 [Pisolithus croceorrhizus]